MYIAENVKNIKPLYVINNWKCDFFKKWITKLGTSNFIYKKNLTVVFSKFGGLIKFINKIESGYFTAGFVKNSL